MLRGKKSGIVIRALMVLVVLGMHCVRAALVLVVCTIDSTPEISYLCPS